MLNRWHEMKREEKYGRMDRRPSHTSMEESVERALQWRAEIVKECSKMIAEIQSDSLDEHRVRDLNDQINKKVSTTCRSLTWELRQI
jgi:predicted translin family RNA/ssDNA-binding protein